jgi:hypothetical protein
MPRGMLMAARAGNRMQARQTYRTIDRMERRRARRWGGTAAPAAAPPPPAAPQPPDYVVELERLAQLHEQGAITDAEFEAKKHQLLVL